MLIQPIQENLFSLKLIDSYVKNWVQGHTAYPWFRRHEDQLKWTQQWECSSGKTEGMDGIKSNRFKVKQVRYVLQLQGKEWLAIWIENRYPKPVLLHLFGSVSSFWIICSHVMPCIENIHSCPGRIATCLCLMSVIISLLPMNGHSQWSQPVLTSRWKRATAHCFVVFLTPFHESPTFLSSLPLYPRDTACRFSTDGNFKKRTLNFCHFCLCLYYRAGRRMPLSENPFHFYFSVVSYEQDELGDIILHWIGKLTNE